MENIKPVKRAYYRYLGVMYWLIHWTDTQRIIGLRLSSLIKYASLLILIVALIQRWNHAGIVLVLLLFLWIQISYWRGRRTGYYRFVSGNVDLRSSNESKPLKPNLHIPVYATGEFSLRNWESNVIFQQAEYWQVPLGDHAVMVQYKPGRYLYQFVSIKKMLDLQKGWLLFGPQPRQALSISFLSTWGPEFDELNISMLGINRKDPEEKTRTIYLSFDNEEDEEAVWQNLLFEARRIRTSLKS